MDSDYNALAKAYQKRIPVVLTLDNWWTGSLKQRLAALTAPWFIHRRFNRAWVPGEPQIPFAQNSDSRATPQPQDSIAPTPSLFSLIYEKRKTTTPSKKILYVGRYLVVKGVRELWRLMELSDEIPQIGYCIVGTGELWDSRAIHPKIIHHGFKQPHELEPHLVDAACIVMPRQKEPWGVVLHEMAIAGLPLLASTRVGAASQFLEHGKNGASFDPPAIAEALQSFLRKDKARIQNESHSSHQLGMKHTPAGWSHTLLSLVQA